VRRPGLLRPLPLRGRLALIAVLAVAVGVAAAAVVAYLATERTLRAQVDRGLLAAPLPARDAGATAPTVPRRSGGAAGSLEALCSGVALGPGGRSVAGSLQLVRADGTTCAPDGSAVVEPRAVDVAAARGGPTSPIRDDVTDDGREVRVRTQAVADGFAVMLVRDLDEMQRTLDSLALAMLAACGLGVALAATAGWTVARAGLRPLDTLTATVEQVGATQRLDVVIPEDGHDEVARLAGAFNRMTAALAASRERQQQLVVDASHELRTPLTSLRTNIELLLRSESTGRDLAAADRRDLLDSVDAQLAEFVQLVTELTRLAHDEPAAEPEDLRLDHIVSRAIARVSLRGETEVVDDIQPWVVNGDPQALERAVVNVLDNAVKFSPPHTRIDVRLHQGRLQISDRGVGMTADEAGRVFERFWRSPAARALPGSGLGLAIVADTVQQHGGQAAAHPRRGGGATFEISLPGRPPVRSHAGAARWVR